MNLKDYINRMQDCDSEFVKVGFTFYPGRRSSGIRIEETFNQKTVRIGKCPKSDIRIPDETAYVTHSKIMKACSGWKYEDRNLAGTEVNKETVNKRTVPLNIDDTLRIGLFEIKILDYSK